MGFSKAISDFYKASYKILIAVAVTIIFFLGYNEFLIDRSLESLNFALAEASSASTITQARGLDMILNCAIIREVAPATIDSSALSKLTFAENIIEYGRLDQQLKDVEFLLKEVAQKKNSERGILLRLLDRVSSFVMSFLGKIAHLPGLISRKPAVEDASAPIPPEAILYEKTLDYAAAQAVYEKYIKENPASRFVPFAKLRLGYLHQKTGDFKNAELIYKELVRDYYGTTEAGIAKRMLWYMAELRKAYMEKEALLEEAKSPVITRPQTQDIYYKLGTIDTSLYLFAEAEENYKKAAEIDPKTYIAAKAEFNIAMNYKLQNQFDKTKQRLRSFIEQYPNSDFVPDARYQIADTLYREQKYDEAIQELQELSKAHGYSPLADLARFETGYIYLVDEYDLTKALEAFGELSRANPLSPYTDFFKQMATMRPTFNIIEFAAKQMTLLLIHRLSHRWAGKGIDYSLQFDPEKAVRFEADVKEEYLNKVGEGRHPKRILPKRITKLVEVLWYHFDFKDGKVHFTFQVRIIGLPKKLKGSVTGRFIITKDKNFRFVAEKGSLDPIPLPGFFINYLTKSSHQLIHEAQLPYIFYQISPEDKHFRAKGVADPQMVEKINGWLKKVDFDPEFRIKFKPADKQEKEELVKLRGEGIRQRRHWDELKAESFVERAEDVY